MPVECSSAPPAVGEGMSLIRKDYKYSKMNVISVRFFSMVILTLASLKFINLMQRSTISVPLDHVFVYSVCCLVVYMAMRLYRFGLYLLLILNMLFGTVLIFGMIDASVVQRVSGWLCYMGACSVLWTILVSRRIKA